MARLNIQWKTQSSVAIKAAATGDATATENAGRARAERPMLVYVMSDDNTDSNTRKLEDICFADERVAIGSKFFDCIKITAGDALQDRLLAAHGDSTPRLLLITRDYDVEEVLEKKELSSGRVVRAMSGTVRKDYSDSFDSMVSNYGKLLNELDRLDGKRALIADKKQRAGDNKSKLKKVEREEAKLQKEMESWKQKEEKLLAFKLKDAEKPKA